MQLVIATSLYLSKLCYIMIYFDLNLISYIVVVVVVVVVAGV